MINLRFSYLILKRLYSKVIICVYVLLAVVVISCLLLSLFFVEYDTPKVKESVILAQKKIKLNPPYDVLPLENQYCTIFEEDVKNQIKFFGKNKRPDANFSSLGCLIGFEGASNRFLLVPQQKYYLKYTAGQLEFSSAATPMWIKITEVDESSMHLKLNFLLSHKNNKEVFQHSKSIVVSQSIVDEESSFACFDGKAYFESLRKLKWWGIDRFYDTYGGLSSSYTSGSQRLDFKGNGSDFLFVNENDLLVFKENQWQLVSPSTETKGNPLVLVQDISPAKMHLVLFDTTGIFQKDIFLNLEKFNPLTIRIEETFTKLRQRSLERITCKIGNKTVILKEGDWVLNTATGWKVLKNYDEIEKYLNLVTKGELFVFDKIEKNMDESSVLKGRLFDPMRSQLQSIRIPLSSQKKNKRLHSKKKLDFSKLDDSSQIASEDEDFLPPPEDDELLRYTTE